MVIQTQHPTIVLSTGGTGGHIFPALAIGEVFKTEGYRVLYVTDTRGFEYLKGVVSSEEICLLSLKGWQGGLRVKLLYLYNLLKSIKKLTPLYKKLAVKAVIGFGGYASLPGVVAGWLLRLPLFIHEQNAVASKVTRLCSFFVQTIFISTQDIKKLPRFVHSKVVFSGMPIRTLRSDPNTEVTFPNTQKLKILVLGGSQGAAIFTRVVPAALSMLPAEMQRSSVIMQQVHDQDKRFLETQYASLGITCILASFFKDVYTHLQAADLVISRSGASSVAEIIHFKKPAIFVPFPYAADDHQTANAKEIVTFGGGWMLPENGNLEKNMSEIIKNLLQDRKPLSLASERLSHLKNPASATKITHMILAGVHKQSKVRT